MKASCSFRKRKMLLLLVLSLLSTCCCAEPTAQQDCLPLNPSPFAVWSEFLSPEEVRSQIPALQRNGISIYQRIPSVNIGDTEYATLLQELACTAGIEVRLWLTLREEDGYWPNEKNVDLFSQKALELASWIQELELPITWIVVDMETDFQTSETLQMLVDEGDLAGFFAVLQGNRDMDAYDIAKEKFKLLVDELHSIDFQVMVTTAPFVLDDLKEKTFKRDSTIQDMFNTPVDGIPWDEVSFLAYTTVAELLLGDGLTPYLVHTYGRDAVRYFGDRAAIDIGVVGDAGIVVGDPITDIEEVRSQIGAAKQAGLNKIHVYSLDGLVGLQEDLDPWLQAFDAPARKVAVQPRVWLFRRLLKLIDKFI